MYYIASFAGTVNELPKKKHRSKTLRNLAIGAGVVGIGGVAAARGIKNVVDAHKLGQGLDAAQTLMSKVDRGNAAYKAYKGATPGGVKTLGKGFKASKQDKKIPSNVKRSLNDMRHQVRLGALQTESPDVVKKANALKAAIQHSKRGDLASQPELSKKIIAKKRKELKDAMAAAGTKERAKRIVQSGFNRPNVLTYF